MDNRIGMILLIDWNTKMLRTSIFIATTLAMHIASPLVASEHGSFEAIYLPATNDRQLAVVKSINSNGNAIFEINLNWDRDGDDSNKIWRLEKDSGREGMYLLQNKSPEAQHFVVKAFPEGDKIYQLYLNARNDEDDNQYWTAEVFHGEEFVMLKNLALPGMCLRASTHPSDPDVWQPIMKDCGENPLENEENVWYLDPK